MLNFHETKMGHKFYECDVPKLARGIERLADANDDSEKVKTYAIIVDGNKLPDMEINRVIHERAKRLVDIKVSVYEINGNVKKEYLLLYVPKNA